jgi:SAM-dependent methyltransferase
MAQITNGIRAILSHPLAYKMFQKLMSPPEVRQNFVSEFICPQAGMKVLDIGCGPADILDDLPAVNYFGFDISAAYIASAQSRFIGRGQFNCKLLEHDDLASMPKFDVVLALGLLHHLDDCEVDGLLRLAAAALRPDGRLVTIDPVLDQGQNSLARFLVKRDRGQNVRSRVGYEQLARAVYASVRAEVRHQVWVPYSHCMMVCTKPLALGGRV